jgi:hypothetical protein
MVSTLGSNRPLDQNFNAHDELFDLIGLARQVFSVTQERNRRERAAVANALL